MEQLNFAHDQGCFFELRMDHTATWRECFLDFRKAGFTQDACVSILSGSAARQQGGIEHSTNRMAIYFGGFRLTSVKLLFRNPGTACCTLLSQSPTSCGLQSAVIEARALPLGFSISLQTKAWHELTQDEALAREYFQSTLGPTLSGQHSLAAAHLESVLGSMQPGEQRRVHGVPALFDGRVNSQVLAVRLKGQANSASAPRFLELWQAPPGHRAERKHILLKHGDNPHSDRFALAMAQVFNHVWQQEFVAVSVAGHKELVQNVTYGIVQAGVRTSVIEVVSGSTAVRSFHDRHSKLMLAMFGDAWWQGDLNDWVPSAALISSAAAAFTTAFVLDVGDRHQDNMLVTRDGRLFNIDFGYLFGEQPRFVDAKPFAIPVAFRTALVQNGPLWSIFKAACIKAFAALVKHRDFVVFQAIEAAHSLGSHFLVTRATTLGRRLEVPAGRQVRDSNLESFVEALGPDLAQRIERGVYGHQAKDIIHERKFCTVM